MSVQDMIKDEIEKLPDNLLSEVLDCIQFIKTKGVSLNRLAAVELSR